MPTYEEFAQIKHAEGLTLAFKANYPQSRKKLYHQVPSIKLTFDLDKGPLPSNRSTLMASPSDYPLYCPLVMVNP